MRISDWSSDVCSSDLTTARSQNRNRTSQSSPTTTAIRDCVSRGSFVHDRKHETAEYQRCQRDVHPEQDDIAALLAAVDFVVHLVTHVASCPGRTAGNHCLVRAAAGGQLAVRQFGRIFKGVVRRR